MEEHPKRSVFIQGATARARIDRPEVDGPKRRLGPFDATPHFRFVKDAETFDKVAGNPEGEHHCPLCNEFFSWQMFTAHAAQCIQARAPRRQFWTAPGTKGALAVFPEERGGA
jgi:hypothetical protein